MSNIAVVAKHPMKHRARCAEHQTQLSQVKDDYIGNDGISGGVCAWFWQFDNTFWQVLQTFYFAEHQQQRGLKLWIIIYRASTHWWKLLVKSGSPFNHCSRNSSNTDSEMNKMKKVVVGGVARNISGVIRSYMLHVYTTRKQRVFIMMTMSISVVTTSFRIILSTCWTVAHKAQHTAKTINNIGDNGGTNKTCHPLNLSLFVLYFTVLCLFATAISLWKDDKPIHTILDSIGAHSLTEWMILIFSL